VRLSVRIAIISRTFRDSIFRISLASAPARSARPRASWSDQGSRKRVRLPGKRQDYFRATIGASVLPQIIRTRIELTRRDAQLMQRGEDLTADKDPAVRGQLEEIREFYEFLEAEQHAILKRWEEHRRKTRR
jgi:hypothetical protein